MLDKTANWNEGSQYTLSSVCIVLCHKNVTGAVIHHSALPIPRIPDCYDIEPQADRQQEFVK
jgi:hypothetical protein